MDELSLTLPIFIVTHHGCYGVELRNESIRGLARRTFLLANLLVLCTKSLGDIYLSYARGLVELKLARNNF